MRKLLAIIASAWLSAAACAQTVSIPNLPGATAVSPTDLVPIDQAVTPSTLHPNGRQTVSAPLSMLNGSFTPISGTPAAGYVPIATGPTTAVWGTTFTAPMTFAPQASSLLPGFTVNQTINGSSGFPTGNAMNLIFISNDNAALSGSAFLNGFEVSHVLSGTSRQGGRQSLAAFLEVATASNASSSNENFVALWGSAFAITGDGGTNTGAGAKGALFGIGSWTDLQSGATNWLSAGPEFDFSVRTGASVRYNTGLALVTHALHGVSGASIDALLSFTGQTGTIGVNNLITIGDYGTAQPLKTTGTILSIVNPNSNAFSAAHGIDLSNGTFSADAFKSTGFSVDGSGNVTSANFITGGNTEAGAAGTFFWFGRAQMASPADGVIKLWNAANTGFTRLDFGGDTSSFPAIKRNAAALNFRLADDSADAAITALTLSVGANQVVGARITGYTAMTGSPDKATAYATSTVTLAQLAGRVAQLQADLTTHGLIGP